MEFLYKAYADSGEVEEVGQNAFSYLEAGRLPAKEKQRMNSEAAGCTR